ncbi:MAG: hypothetical protein J4G18_11450 [Anaerolineae bacterium]|nr:hypothetical protein [Anaerolineae bacterium]
MMNTIIAVAIMLCLLLAGGASASDHDETLPYYRMGAVNVPILEGWANQSSADFAQFELTEAQATIRTAFVSANNGIDAAQAELGEMLGMDIDGPVYSDKVNLADGTWNVLAFDIDEATTASSMARRSEAGFIVINFVERNPAARTVLVAITQADESRDVADPEIARMTEALAGVGLTQFSGVEVIDLASGTWRVFRHPELTAMGTVFGNESYVALQEGQPGDLATLADAYNRTLLGFFVTPDNSHYLALGLAVVFLILGTLVFSFSWRSRGIQRDLALIQQLAQSED